LDETTPTTQVISLEEKAFREALVAYGRGTVRLEGFEPSEAFKALNSRYIAGESLSRSTAPPWHVCTVDEQ